MAFQKKRNTASSFLDFLGLALFVHWPSTLPLFIFQSAFSTALNSHDCHFEPSEEENCNVVLVPGLLVGSLELWKIIILTGKSILKVLFSISYQ